MPELATLPLPAPTVAPAVVRAPRWGQRIDAVTTGLVLAFAFVSASFVARNSDVWLHRAAGRLLAHGDYRFGVDPFAYTSADRYWANHAWLFDIGLYAVWQGLGAAGAVALKALVVAATAALMFAVARGRGPAWLASLTVLVGVLALGPRILVQPVVLSYLLLALCLVCLRKGGPWLRAIPVAIAVWMNVDGWFVLGPLLVGLFWLGRKLGSDERGLTGPNAPWPRWFVPASLGACLLSPHHVRALVLPLELSPSVWLSPFPDDPRLSALFASPWHLRPLGAAGGYNLAAWAFFVLFALGLVSFALNRRALRSWRGTVWLTFALLAAWQARLVPFFAVVGAPIAALNLREVVPPFAAVRLGRAFTFVLSLTLVGLGVLGWETGFHNRDRGIGWGIHTDATLARAAEGIAQWRESAPADGQVFTAHPDLGHYLAWFAPGERAFLDSRLPLFASVADDWESLSRAFGFLPGDVDRTRTSELLQRYHTIAVALYDPDVPRMTAALERLTHEEAARWEIARIDGGVVLIVPKGTQGSRFDPEKLAYGPPTANGLPQVGNGPPTLLEPDPWRWLEPRHGRTGSWEADAATVYLRLDEETATSARSSAWPLLAVRAARIGIEKDPRDATAWLMLARAYQRLSADRPDAAATEALTPLASLRQVQIAAALVQAVLISPDLAPAHESLAGAYFRGRSLDLALHHLDELLRIVRRTGAGPGESADAFLEREANLAAQSERLEAMVQDAENRYVIRTIALSGEPLARARIAADLGLHQKAIDVLLASHPDLYGVEGLNFLADLLLRTGRIAEARAFLDRPDVRRNPAALRYYSVAGKPHPDGHHWSYQFAAYDWFQLCASAGQGRYDEAQEVVQRMAERFEWEEQTLTPPLTQALARQVALEVGFSAPHGSLLFHLLAVRERGTLTEQLAHVRYLTVARGDMVALSALLELERGRTETALAQGEAALRLYDMRKGQAPAFPGEALARRCVEDCRKYR